MERLRRTRDWAARTFAATLPKRVRYFSAIQGISYATRNATTDVMEIRAGEILKNLDTPKNMS